MRQTIIALFSALLLVSCTKSDNGATNSATNIRFDAAYANTAAGAASEVEKIDAMTAYICSEGEVKKIYALTDLSDLSIEDKYHYASSTLYVVGNPSACPAAANIGVGSAQTAIDDLIVEGEVTKVPLAGKADLSGKVGQTISLKLERAVARFDLVIEQNRGIEVETVIFDGVPTSAPLWPIENPSTDRTKYTFTPKTTTNLDGLLYCYAMAKSDKEATVTLDVRYDGKLATVVVPISEIKRNFAYNLSIYAYNGRVTATLDASTMEEGDSDTGVVGYTHTVIDSETTILCDNAQILTPTMIRLPNNTCQLTLGLTGHYDKTFTVEGDPDQFTVIAVEGGDYTSNQLTISVERNKAAGHGGRAAILCVSHVERGATVVDRISIIQTPPEPFAAVTIGGLEWMSVNAIGKDLSLYTTPAPGQSLRDMLKANWHKYAGACYQWGPRKSYNTLAPWDVWAVQGNQFVNKNGPIINMPTDWIWPEATTPCPAGWRLPTAEECARIWPPNGKELPITYTNDGVEYTMTLEPSGLSMFIYVHGEKKLYNAVISDGVNELIFPAGGTRNESNIDASGSIYGFGAKIGASFTLRTQKALQAGGNGAGIGLVRPFNNDAEVPQVLNVPKQTNTWTVSNTFCNVRCVREIEK